MITNENGKLVKRYWAESKQLFGKIKVSQVWKKNDCDFYIMILKKQGDRWRCKTGNDLHKTGQGSSHLFQERVIYSFYTKL